MSLFFRATGDEKMADMMKDFLSILPKTWAETGLLIKKTQN
jgi:hypothetical protein